MKFLVVNGPNLNMLGTRETHIYGDRTLEDINQEITRCAVESGVEVDFFQSNIEGELVDVIQKAASGYNGIVINAAAYTHYSIAIRDALSTCALPAIEVHISNVHRREEFRHHSTISSVCIGQIVGLGEMGYVLALAALTELAK